MNEILFLQNQASAIQLSSVAVSVKYKAGTLLPDRLFLFLMRFRNVGEGFYQKMYQFGAMTNSTKIIIQEIGSMGLSELEAIQNEVARMINLKKMEALLEAFIGAGTGIWDQDAQDYVDGLREED